MIGKIHRQKSLHRTCARALHHIGARIHVYGRRVSTTTAEGTIRHVYDGAQCIADLDADGEVVVSYTWGEGIDNLLAVKVGGATYYPLTNVQGFAWIDSLRIFGTIRA